MSKKNIADLIIATDIKIKSGGVPSLTKALDLRKLLEEDYLESIPNLVDGGMGFDSEVGYSDSSQKIVTDKNAFIPKGQVDIAISKPNVYSITSSASIQANYESYSCISVLAQALNINVDDPVGVNPPGDFQPLLYRFKGDTSGAWTITWGPAFEGTFIALPTTISITGKVLVVGFLFDVVKDKWCCINSIEEL